MSCENESIFCYEKSNPASMRKVHQMSHFVTLSKFRFTNSIRSCALNKAEAMRCYIGSCNSYKAVTIQYDSQVLLAVVSVV